MTANKKIVNATPTQVKDIQFKSKLEASIYKALVDRGFEPLYEPDKFLLWKGINPIGFIKNGKLITKKLIDITYTPDFKVNFHNLCTLYIEVKGFPNDVYPYKRKLFLSLINNTPNTYFIEVSTVKGLVASLSKLYKLYENISS